MFEGYTGACARPVDFPLPTLASEESRSPTRSASACVLTSMALADRSDPLPESACAMIGLVVDPRTRRRDIPTSGARPAAARAATRARSRRSTRRCGGTCFGFLVKHAARPLRRRGRPAAGVPRGLATGARLRPAAGEPADLGDDDRPQPRDRSAAPPGARAGRQPAGARAGARRRRGRDRAAGRALAPGRPARARFIPTRRSVLRLRFYDELTQSRSPSAPGSRSGP